MIDTIAMGKVRNIAEKCTWIFHSQLRVLRTINRYWIAKINTRTAEASIILHWRGVSLSLLFSYSAVFACSLFTSSFRSAKWFDVRMSWAVECRHNESSVQHRPFVFGISSTFKFNSIRFSVCCWLLAVVTVQYTNWHGAAKICWNLKQHNKSDSIKYW